MKKTKTPDGFERAINKGFRNQKTFAKFLEKHQDRILEMMSEGRRLDGKRYICDSNFIIYAVRYAVGRKTYAVSKVVRFVLDQWERMEDLEREMIIKEILRYEQDFGELGDFFDREEWYRIINRNIYALITETL